jgi:hypothetical protein
MNFNYPDKKHPIACDKCKKPGMKNIVDRKCSCGKISIFNFEGEIIGIACFNCKKEGMVDVIHPICPGHEDTACPVRTRLYNGRAYCASCDPDPNRSQQRKKFEDAFFAFAEGKINIEKREFRVNFDQTHTTKKFARIDGIVFRNDVIVCIEIDENGHADDSYSCDESRMHLVTGELLQKYPGYDVAWVRVNPMIPDLANQWTKKAKIAREKLFSHAIGAIVIIAHGIEYISN